MYITYADALKFLQEAVEERGEDYINKMYKDDSGLDSCVYRVPATGEPSCGVGVVLSKAGFDLNTLTDHENGKQFSRLYESLRGAGLLYMAASTRQLLRIFQEMQDSAEPWGAALQFAMDKTTAPDPETDVMSSAY